MGIWSSIEIRSFLKERKEKLSPAQANMLGLKRLEKIDFFGNIHVVEDKHTNTDMIIIKNGDLVISGINVEKGALVVYEGIEDILATIHYSAYEFDSNQIDIEYLKWFLKSNVFLNMLKEQSGGGIKTELKPKRFLPLKILLPNLETQKDISKKISSVSEEINEVKKLNNDNKTTFGLLRQSILQEAVQGQLVPQDPNDEPASELLKKIQTEKEWLIKGKKIKKEKPLPPIKEEEIPCELPGGWTWVRLSEVGEFARGQSKHRPRNDPKLFYNGSYPMIQTGDVARSRGIINTYSNMYNDFGLQQSRLWPTGTLCITIAANIADTGILGIDACFPDSVVGYIPFKPIESAEYFRMFIEVSKKNLTEYAPSTAQKNINLSILNNLLIPLPPYKEQERILHKVDQLMQLCDEVEASITQAQKDSDLLMQAVLQEAFKGQ